MLVTLLAALVPQVSPTPAALATEVGARLPDLVLPRIDAADAGPASSLELASLRGKRVLLLQFASW